MIIEFECRHCKTKLRAEDSIANPKALCPVCNKKIIVPKKNQRKLENKEKQKSLR
jgi:DNA-directed RNA polymerase subunit RPC12/RpoP